MSAPQTPSDPNAGGPPVLRGPDGKLLPGTRGMNPRGRPKTGLAFSQMVRDVAGHPNTMRELVQLALDVAFGRAVCVDGNWQRACAEARRKGEPMPPRPDNGEVIQPTMAEIQRAWDFLIAWGFRKPAVEVEVSSENGRPVFDPSKLTDDELEVAERLFMKAQAIDVESIEK